MTRLEAFAHEEEIIETSSDAIVYLVGRGLREGKITLLYSEDGPPTIDWAAAAAYLETLPDYWKVTAESAKALAQLQADFEAEETTH